MKNNNLLIKELSERLFYTNKWPHYKVMFNHLDNIISKIDEKARIAILERCYIYDGLSIFSSLFESKNLYIIDFIPPNSTNKSRQNYQKDKLLSLPLTYKYSSKSKISATVDNLSKVFEKSSFDYIFIPNVLHHHPNPFELLNYSQNGLKKGGYLYIFDAILREQHQKPDDYIRFTPDGIKYALEKNGFKIKEIFTSNSPVEALLYTMDQIVQYDLPGELLNDIKNLKELVTTKYEKTLHRNYTNLIRKHTSFPIAYSVLAKKN